MNHWDYLEIKCRIPKDIIRYCVQPMLLPAVKIIRNNHANVIKELNQINMIIDEAAQFQLVLYLQLISAHIDEIDIALFNPSKLSYNRICLIAILMLKYRSINANEQNYNMRMNIKISIINMIKKLFDLRMILSIEVTFYIVKMLQYQFDFIFITSAKILLRMHTVSKFFRSPTIFDHIDISFYITAYKNSLTYRHQYKKDLTESILIEEIEKQYITSTIKHNVKEHNFIFCDDELE